MGFWATAAEKTEREQALRSSAAIAGELGDVAKREEQAAEWYRRDVQRQLARDAIGVPALSPEAAKVANVLGVAETDQARAAIYAQCPAEVREEFQRFQGLVLQRFGFRGPAPAQIAHLREVGVAVERIVAAQAMVDSISRGESAVREVERGLSLGRGISV